MADTPLHWQTMTELSLAIHRGTLSPVRLMEHLLERAKTCDPHFGSFESLPVQAALDGARAAELALQSGYDAGPLHGIPFAVKDIIDVRGLPTTAGSSALAQNIADDDATVVRRLRRAGMVLMGKTRTVQFALGAPGINRDRGTPRNPWQPTHHVPGGSSSGSAVAVAAGLVPVALGSDTGGSIRIPAALCGVTGLKPTVSQVSRAGVFPLSETLDSVGPLTRSVEDAALVHQALHGPDPRDPATRAAVNQDVLATLTDGVDGLRIGMATGLLEHDLGEDVGDAVKQVARCISGLGARVERIEIDEAEMAVNANPRMLISSVEAALAHQQRLPDFDRYDETLAFRLQEGCAARAIDYLRARRECNRLAALIDQRFNTLDAFVSATTPDTTRPIEVVDSDAGSYQYWNARYSRNTAIANLLGLCAISIPCGLDRDGRPIGLMIHARAGGEATALRVARALEPAIGWDRQPPDPVQPEHQG